MKNKLAMLLMTILLIFTAIPFQAQAATSFKDVKGHWAIKEITYLSDRNIISGYPDGTFKPNQPITRAQASAMMIKALKIPLTTDTSMEFKDVPKDSKYYQILATVNEKGILRGDNGFMRPGEPASRAHMAAILRRAFDMKQDKQGTFIDVPSTHWAYQDINGIAKQRVAGGFEGKFMPTDAVTRSQFSAFLVRALEDTMKLSSYKSYVSQKGTTVERDGNKYFINEAYVNKDLRHRVIKENSVTGKRDVLLKSEDVPRTEGDDVRYAEYLKKGFRLIMYNDEIYMPYWAAGYRNVDEAPYSFGLMKMNLDGQNLVKMKQPGYGGFRNLFIWNDRMYFTLSGGNTANRNGEYNDNQLTFFSTALDGVTDERKEGVFTASETFDLYEISSGKEAGGENRSVVYDHSTMYYFNASGVYKYNLLTKKTAKVSDVVARDMYVTDMELIITDSKGKKFVYKK